MRSLTTALLLACLLAGPAAAGGDRKQAAGYEVVHGWPVLPDGMILGPAAGVGVDSKGDVWVFQRANRFWEEPLPIDPIKYPTVVHFDGKSGRVISTWGAGLFAMPHGLTIDNHDNLWLTDVALHQIFKFSADGKLLLTLGEVGVPGDDAGHFNRPTDVAVLLDGSFYVSDGYRNTRVVKFDAKGRFQFQWGRPGTGPGEFNTPHGIKVDNNGLVYVADRENDRVQIFTPDGKYLSEWRSSKIGRPYGITLLDRSTAAIVDGGEQPDMPPDRSGVAIVSLDGSVLEQFARFGNQDGQFRMGHDIASDAQGNLYVVDITGQRVQKFVRNLAR